MYNLDETRMLIEDFFGDIDTEEVNQKYTWSMQVSNKDRQILSGAPCHAGFYKINNPLWISSMFFFHSRNEDVASAYWNWITDKKESPWRKVVQELEPLTGKNNNRVGWIIPGKSVEKVDFKLVKNFAIACRGLSEHRSAIKMWYTLVNKGINPADALLYSSNYIMSENGTISCDEYRDGGWHWPLTTNLTNINTFRKGEYKSSGGINIGWSPPKPTRLEGIPRQGKVIKTKFSEFKSIELQSILDHHKNWIKRVEKVTA